MSRWNPSAHPRDAHGRFRSKGRITVRASMRSATVQYGRTLPLIPGKANLYLGVLARVEKAGDKQSFVEKKVDAAVNKLVSKIPQNRAAGRIVANLIQHRESDVGGFKVGRTGRRRSASSIRVTNSKSATAGRKVRQPRKPRAPRQPR